MLPARMQMYTRACAASLESLLDVYLERLEALSVKQSGYGKDMSIYALVDYTAVRHIMINHG